jgi:hypothetical protein
MAISSAKQSCDIEVPVTIGTDSRPVKLSGCHACVPVLTWFESSKTMPDKECPMCGTTMRLKITQVVTPVPGNPRPATRTLREWICPDCDYFEDAEET